MAWRCYAGGRCRSPSGGNRAMTAATNPASSPVGGAVPSPRQQFLDAYEREYAITMKVLRAYPPDKAELRPHPKLKTARELAYVFVQECGLGIAGLNDAFGKGESGPSSPPVPEKWEDVLDRKSDVSGSVGCC